MRFLRQEVCYLLVAVQFLTRLPVPDLANFQTSWLNESAKYFPLVGILVGALCWVVLWLTAPLLPGPLPAIFAILAGIVITGAFHEDGFADFFDSMGGSSSSERLAIMKDSRIGTYGALSLIGLFAVKVSALSSLPLSLTIGALIGAHAFGRFAAVVTLAYLPYAGDLSAAKAKPLAMGISRKGLLVAGVFATSSLLLLPLIIGCVAAFVGAIAALLVARRAQSLLGGYTGDVLGAVESIFEAAFLTAIAASLKSF